MITPEKDDFLYLRVSTFLGDSKGIYNLSAIEIDTFIDHRSKIEKKCCFERLTKFILGTHELNIRPDGTRFVKTFMQIGVTYTIKGKL